MARPGRSRLGRSPQRLTFTSPEPPSSAPRPAPWALPSAPHLNPSGAAPSRNGGSPQRLASLHPKAAFLKRRTPTVGLFPSRVSLFSLNLDSQGPSEAALFPQGLIPLCASCSPQGNFSPLVTPFFDCPSFLPECPPFPSLVCTSMTSSKESCHLSRSLFLKDTWASRNLMQVAFHGGKYLNAAHQWGRVFGSSTDPSVVVLNFWISNVSEDSLLISQNSQMAWNSKGQIIHHSTDLWWTGPQKNPGWLKIFSCATGDSSHWDTQLRCLWNQLLFHVSPTFVMLFVLFSFFWFKLITSSEITELLSATWWCYTWPWWSPAYLWSMKKSSFLECWVK